MNRLDDLAPFSQSNASFCCSRCRISHYPLCHRERQLPKNLRSHPPLFNHDSVAVPELSRTSQSRPRIHDTFTEKRCLFRIASFASSKSIEFRSNERKKRKDLKIRDSVCQESSPESTIDPRDPIILPLGPSAKLSCIPDHDNCTDS